jgi:predicted porin
MASTVLAPSVIGFRGNEKLGGGYAAGFNLETAINLNNGNAGSATSGVGGTSAQNGYLPSDGTSTLFYRQANVQVDTAEAGSFKFGRQLTPTFVASFNADALSIASGGIGIATNLANPGFIGGTSSLSGVQGPLNPDTNVSSVNGSPINYSNGIGWDSQKYYGVTVHALWGLNQNAPMSSNYANQQAIQNVVVNYENGPYTALYGYMNATDNTGNRLVSTNIAGLGYTVGSVTVKGTYFGGRFGSCSQTTSGGNCQTKAMSISAAGVVTPATMASAGTPYGDNFDAYALGVSWQASARSRVAVQYTQILDQTTTGNKAGISSIYADYDLSKRTKLFALVSYVDNVGQANVSPIYALSSATPNNGNSITAVAAGMKVSF